MHHVNSLNQHITRGLWVVIKRWMANQWVFKRQHLDQEVSNWQLYHR